MNIFTKIMSITFSNATDDDSSDKETIIDLVQESTI